MRPRLLALATTVAALATVVASGAQAAPSRDADARADQVGIELVAHPDQAGMGRRGMVSIVAEVRAGGVVEREVVVSNDTGDSLPLEVYVGGARVDEDGFVVDDDERLVAGWSQVEPRSTRLDPGGRERVTVRLAVPDDAPDGEHFGVVWLQPPASGGAIREVNRVGIRIYLSTSGGAPTAATGASGTVDFVIDAMTPRRLADGRPQVLATVRNVGDRVVDLVGQLELSDGPGRSSAGPFPTDVVTTVAPGLAGTVVVTLPDDLPAGPWLGRLVLASGAVERAAEATLLFPTEADDAGREVPATMTPVERQRQVLIPIASTLLVTLLVIVFVLWRGWRRARRAAGRQAASPDDGLSGTNDMIVGTRREKEIGRAHV